MEDYQPFVKEWKILDTEPRIHQQSRPAHMMILRAEFSIPARLILIFVLFVDDYYLHTMTRNNKRPSIIMYKNDNKERDF